MEVTGILKVKSDVNVVSERFKKRDFVLTVEPGSPYPQHVTFQLVQDKVNMLDNFNVGDEIKVLFNLKGREWTSPQGEIKYFNTIDAWRMEKVGSAQTQSQTSNTSNTAGNTENTNPPVFTSTSADDDLPF